MAENTALEAALEEGLANARPTNFPGHIVAHGKRLV